MPGIRRLLYFIIVAVVAVTASALFPSAHTNWMVCAAFSLSLITFGNTFLQRLDCLFLTGLAMAAGVFLSGALAWVGLPALYAFLCAATLLLVYGMNRWPAYLLPLLLVNVFVLLGMIPAADLAVNVDRMLLILIGTAIALVPQVIFWPHYISNQIKQAVLIAIKELQGLTNDVFNCLLQPDYKEKLYLYEKRVHSQKSKLLTARQRLNFLIEKNKNLSGTNRKALKNCLAHLDLLYESFISCAQVRWRSADHTIFAVCQQDLAGILQEINQAYHEFVLILTTKNKLHADLSTLTVRINQLEQTYQNVMQVTAKEPVILLLFVASLQAFAVELAAFNSQLTQLRAIFK